jgi:hypothetical protein
MVNLLRKKREPADFDKFGYETMLECGDDEKRAQTICGLRIHALVDELQSTLTRLQSEIEQARRQAAALHAYLYDGPEPVEDAAMLTYSHKVRNTRILVALAAFACLAGNFTTFYLFGFNLFLTFILAAFITGLPLVVGHPTFEYIVAKHVMLKVAICLLGVGLAAMSVIRLGEARRLELGKTTASSLPAGIYVAGEPAESPMNDGQKDDESTESKVRETLGGAMFYITLAAELMLGFLVGKLGDMRADKTYAAWRQLEEKTHLITKQEETVSELHAYVEIARKRCAEGMLRAQNKRNNRKPPYHTLLGLLLLIGFAGGTAHAQTIEHKEGILIDVSGSIGRGGATNELFREYLTSTRNLLLSEPAKTRVWVSSISTDSFGAVREVVRGWTPESRGVFTDDMNRARHQLAASFEKNASGMSASSAGTDIFGGLWHMKALFESGPASGDHDASKTIWILSDMINETKEFQIPAILPNGPEKMLEQARANGLLVPLKGYRIYIYGASPTGLTPQGWLTLKNFWAMYFAAAGAELVSYSAECDVQR